MAENEDSDALVLAIKENQVEAETGLVLQNAFAPFFEQAKEWKQKAEQIKITDISQTREMQVARQARLALKEIRVNADKTRKRLKEDSLRYGKAVQGVYNVIEYLVEPIEKYLQEQEDFPKIQEANRKEVLANERAERLRAYDCQTGGFNLGEMDENSFLSLLNGAKKTFEDAIEAKRKEEEERIENARVQKLHNERREKIIPFSSFWTPDLASTNLGTLPEDEFDNILMSLGAAKNDYLIGQEKIRLENERLKKEQEEKDKLIVEERRKAEADKKALEEKARKEREEKEKKIMQLQEEAAAAKAKADFELRKEVERQATERARVRELEKQRKKAASAPDKTKLLALAEAFETVPFPVLSTDEGKAILKQIQELQAKLVNFINQKMETL